MGNRHTHPGCGQTCGKFLFARYYSWRVAFFDKSIFIEQFPDLASAVDALTVSSEYFEVSIRAQVDDAQVELVSVLRRDPGSGRVELLSRDLSKNYQSLFLAGQGAPDSSP